MANPLNDRPRSPIDTGARPQHSDSQGGITSPLDPFRASRLPYSQHPALQGGRAGNAPIVTPIVVPQPTTRDTGTNQRSR
jgi:hypothetical protein